MGDGLQKKNIWSCSNRHDGTVKSFFYNWQISTKYAQFISTNVYVCILYIHIHFVPNHTYIVPKSPFANIYIFTSNICSESEFDVE